MSLPYMQFFPADYFAKTRRLTCLEHGAYLQLLFMMWESNGVLRFDVGHLSDELGLTVEEFEQVWTRVGRYFQLKKGRIYNKRISEDLANKKGISEKRKKASEKRWSEKSNESNDQSDANAFQSDPILQKPEPEPEVISLSDARALISEAMKEAGEAIASPAECSGIAVYTTLLALIDGNPDSPPCTEAEVLDGVRSAAAWYLGKHGPRSMRNWDLAVKKALQARDERLRPKPVGEPPPTTARNASAIATAQFAAARASILDEFPDD